MDYKSKELASKGVMPVWLRIVLVIFSFLFLTAIFQIIGVATTDISMDDLMHSENLSTGQMFFLQFLGTLAMFSVVLFYRKFIDKLSIKSLGFGLKCFNKDMIRGFVLALICIGMGSLVLYVLGYVEIENNEVSYVGFLLQLLLFFLVAVNEEVLVRGYILNNLMLVSNKYLALFISSLIFMVLHLLNPNLSTIGVINLFLAGIMLGSAYVFTQNLWFAISLHLFWNFIQGPVMGYSVSGMAMDSVFKLKLSGNEIWHGGAFGFEGSLMCTIVLIVSIASIIGYYHRSKKVNLK
ncbi:lysostaphin resistance A-like protein [Carboxylicivirga sp. N1Y90]|uniref:CPBP family intramembrane glutamic endopeptidase n=1 Tax=Carboxylicivirga fragile TaxID=3417571 RepID=UPI003D33486A|nr:CPBP family intramembrane metalloprotease [Marinilabiliaceae bacterium N1Y90]